MVLALAGEKEVCKGMEGQGAAVHERGPVALVPRQAPRRCQVHRRPRVPLRRVRRAPLPHARCDHLVHVHRLGAHGRRLGRWGARRGADCAHHSVGARGGEREEVARARGVLRREHCPHRALRGGLGGPRGPRRLHPQRGRGHVGHEPLHEVQHEHAQARRVAKRGLGHPGLEGRL